MVPQSGFEPERARLLRPVGVPVSTSHRGSSNEIWQGVKESNLLNVWIKTRCRPTWRTPNRFDPSGALHWAYARTYAVLLRRGIWYRIGDSNPSVQSESLLTSPEVECDMYLVTRKTPTPWTVSARTVGIAYAAETCRSTSSSLVLWSPLQGSNLPPHGPKPSALPNELNGGIEWSLHLDLNQGLRNYEFRALPTMLCNEVPKWWIRQRFERARC